MNRRHLAGKGVIGCLVALVLVAVVATIAYKVIPKRIAVAELQDYCEEQAERASLPEYNDEAITTNLLEKAKKLDLPVGAENVQINRESGLIHVLIKYTIPLRFPGYTYRWDVTHNVERVLF